MKISRLYKSYANLHMLTDFQAVYGYDAFGIVLHLVPLDVFFRTDVECRRGFIARTCFIKCIKSQL